MTHHQLSHHHHHHSHQHQQPPAAWTRHTCDWSSGTLESPVRRRSSAAATMNGGLDGASSNNWRSSTASSSSSSSSGSSGFAVRRRYIGSLITRFYWFMVGPGGTGCCTAGPCAGRLMLNSIEYWSVMWSCWYITSLDRWTTQTATYHYPIQAHQPPPSQLYCRSFSDICISQDRRRCPFVVWIAAPLSSDILSL